MPNSISLTDNELFAVPVMIENDNVFDDIDPVVNTALDNIEDQFFAKVSSSWLVKPNWVSLNSDYYGPPPPIPEK